jgi:hypothetical protein
VLSQGDRFRGDITLAVGLGKAYAEGNIHFVVDYNPVLNAAGGMEFFVYGPNAWGIMGGANMTYLATVSAQSDFFIGPPGFIVSGEISHSFDIWIVRVRSAFGMMAWYHRSADLAAITPVGVTHIAKDPLQRLNLALLGCGFRVR